MLTGNSYITPFAEIAFTSNFDDTGHEGTNDIWQKESINSSWSWCRCQCRQIPACKYSCRCAYCKWLPLTTEIATIRIWVKIPRHSPGHYSRQRQANILSSLEPWTFQGFSRGLFFCICHSKNSASHSAATQPSKIQLSIHITCLHRRPRLGGGVGGFKI